jgi:hypothetical protein
MAGTSRKALACQPMGTGGTLLSCSSRQRSDCSWFRPSSIPRSCMARKWDTTKAVKDKMSAVVKKALRSSILALHPRDSPDVLYGDTATSTRLIDAAKLCWQHRCQNRLARGEALFSFEVAGVGRPKVARTGAVMSNHY